MPLVSSTKDACGAAAYAAFASAAALNVDDDVVEYGQKATMHQWTERRPARAVMIVLSASVPETRELNKC